jgi:hypothetical protein
VDFLRTIADLPRMLCSPRGRPTRSPSGHSIDSANFRRVRRGMPPATWLDSEFLRGTPHSDVIARITLQGTVGRTQPKHDTRRATPQPRHKVAIEMIENNGSLKRVSVVTRIVAPSRNAHQFPQTTLARRTQRCSPYTVIVPSSKSTSSTARRYCSFCSSHE